MPLRLILALALFACGAFAQQRTVSSSTRPGVNDKREHAPRRFSLWSRPRAP